MGLLPKAGVFVSVFPSRQIVLRRNSKVINPFFLMAMIIIPLIMDRNTKKKIKRLNQE